MAALGVAAVAVLASCTPGLPPAAQTASSTPSDPVSTIPPGAGSAANRVIFWTTCADLVWMSDAELDQWRARGVTGFSCGINYLYEFGGENRWTPDPNASLAGPEYMMQREIRDTGIVQRAASRGIKLWLSMSITNYWNNQTPLAEWFDDASWANQAVPNVRDLAGAAKLLGFAGIGFDLETYGGAYGAPSWEWNYRGNTHTEAQVRAKVKARGAQFMQAIVAGFPGVDILAVHPSFPEGWGELVQQQINNLPSAYASLVEINFWDGMSSVPGYGEIRFLNHDYNKVSHLWQSTWDTAFQYDLNRMYAMFSRRFSNWSYASSHVQWEPFAWIDSGPTAWDFARPPDYVAQQLAAFRKWSPGGAFGNFAYGPLDSFDYTPYVPGLQAAAAPGIVDSQPPGLALNGPSRSGNSVSLSGSATDNRAIRSVVWQTASGKLGTATMNWTVTSGNWAVGYQWRMDWNASIPAAPGEAITVTAFDTNGLPTTRTVAAP